MSPLLLYSLEQLDIGHHRCNSGYNIGIRLIEDFLAKTSTPRCMDMKDVADKIQSGFKLYFGTAVSISKWSRSNDEFSLIIDSNPLTEFVELPDHLRNQLR